MTNPQLPPLPQHVGAKVPEIVCISTDETAWFLSQAENPFCPRALHPSRRALDLTRQKINRGAQANANRHPERPIIHAEPLFRFGATERNQKQVGFSFANALGDHIV